MRRRGSIDHNAAADDFDDVFDDPQEDQELKALERRLNEEVDEDLFEEPKQFNTLRRVIDVLGLQMIDDAASAVEAHNLDKNPAYRNLKDQQKIVNGAIEHMAVIHCADLNGSVIQVGRVARQFADAVSKVRGLRKQVREIQDTLGAAKHHNEAATTKRTTTAMSLRELWLKKLECESTLALLGRLDVVRAAPTKFDALVKRHRIGAGVLEVTRALQTMFADDIAQVQALHKIMEQLLIRKQRAEEIVWETISDVVFLRTANEPKARVKVKKQHHGAQSISSESRQRFRSSTASVSSVSKMSGIANPFVNDDASEASDHSGASLFSVDEDDDDASDAKTTDTLLSTRVKRKMMMIPIPIIEADLDLDADERRCLEEVALLKLETSEDRPQYADSVLALRILVECLAKLGRLDDLERVVSENLEREIRSLVQTQQHQTFSRLERTTVKSDSLRDFRRHLTSLMSSFGCILLRLSHLAEVVRLRISSDRELLQKMDSSSSYLRTLISSATEIMQREVKEFLKACLHEAESTKTETIESVTSDGFKTYESGLFSLGITDTGPQRTQRVLAAATRSNVMEMSTAKFVSKVLFSKTKVTPEVRHALTFRRGVARWTNEIETMKMELATLTQEDKSSPSFKSTDETAIGFLDGMIQDHLLPVLQEEAVNGTVRGLERTDAFDPVMSRGLYANVSSNDPLDIEMCISCQAIYQSTGPLFLALHRLPRGGEMYMPLVAVLEHVMLTFISRVKKQVSRICQGKTALTLLLQDGKGPVPLSAIMDRRRPCALLSAAYADGDFLDPEVMAKKQQRVNALSPSESDTISRREVSESKSEYEALDNVALGVHGEEQLMALELQYLSVFFDFSTKGQAGKIVLSSDEELMKASCLAHSLLKLSGLLESRLKVRGINKTLTSTRALREANRTIRTSGMKMAKFCRLEMLMQVASRMSKVCQSSTLVARDAVRIPSSVNELGEYLTAASDNLREAAGNAVTAYCLSSLEQFIPYSLMQNVRAIAAGEGVVTKSALTMNGIEALDRSGSVLYRDLKGSTSFDNSFWDMELAAISFERSASFMAMMELEMEELVAYYTANHTEFSEEDFALMFASTAPRRRGDAGRFHLAKKNLR